MLKKGDTIPDVELVDQKGQSISLHSFRGKSALVIYFYPKDNTAVCTAQACGFRDHYEDFLELGATVIGISKDSVSSHKNVSEKRKLPFPLLSDPKGKALKAFGVPTYLFGLLPGRVTFIADNQCIIQHTFRADFKADVHIHESLNILRKLMTK